ncbi:hypothetical protein RHGRI_037430 [Rhododendron griersonianum]|uniref:CCHC-type domain-containing protein n=4 Tax=Rhododendron griersonianum TaxID=479676 RepID=A0AAV6HUV3_9ERIC|nr:hypothetical protein RHGRI_037430 [Rhododendron griersonianum]
MLKRKNMNLENDMHNLFETNMLLESKVAKLQVELDKTNTTFKKLNTGTRALNEVLSFQKVTVKREGLGYVGEASTPKVEGKTVIIKPNSCAPSPPVANKTKSSLKENKIKCARIKPNSTKAKMKSATVEHATTKCGEVNLSKFMPTCHHCGVKGHIRPHCRKLQAPNTSHTNVVYSHDHNKFISTCHFCGVKGHIRPNCFKLHGYPKTPPQYHLVNHNGDRCKYFGYGFNRIQKPKRRVISHEKYTNVMSKHVPKIVEKFE